MAPTATTLTPTPARVEWEHINRVLADCGGNVSKAAQALGIHRRSLQRKLSKFRSARWRLAERSGRANLDGEGAGGVVYQQGSDLRFGDPSLPERGHELVEQ